MANGHPDARHYTLGRVHEEAMAVMTRLNADQSRFFNLLLLTASTLPNQSVKPSSTEKARRLFDRLLNRKGR